MTTVAGTGPAPVWRQAARGVGFLAGGIGALATAVLLDRSVKGQDSDFTATADWRAVGTAVIVVLLVGGYLTLRSLRRWAGRPRWLITAASLLAMAALVPAVWAPAPANLDSGGCVPLISAWQPVVATPSAADLAVYQSGFGNLTKIELRDKATVAAVVARDKVIQATPAWRRVERFGTWLDSDAACAPRSRTALGGSALGLGLGAAALGVAARRRQR